MRPGGLATSRRIDSAVTLLPQPDLADDAQGFAGAYFIGHAVDRAHHARPGEEMRVQVVDFENVLTRRCQRDIRCFPVATP